MTEQEIGAIVGMEWGSGVACRCRRWLLTRGGVSHGRGFSTSKVTSMLCFLRRRKAEFRAIE